MILNGKALSEQIQLDLKNRIKDFIIKPCLAVIQVGDDKASNTYINSKIKACSQVGIYFKHVKFNDTASEREIINKILELNNDDYIDGIIIQLPLPKRFDPDKFINIIAKNKDVDGLTDINCGKLFKGSNLAPCTPMGILTLLKSNNIEVAGKNVVIVGKSNLVGKPLGLLLLNEGATVTICHSKTQNLSEHTKRADILISATGVKHLIKKNMVNKNAVVVDVGIVREDKLYGDVDFDNVSKIVTAITPVPGGVGPMTVAMLLSNVVLNFENKKREI